MKTIRLYFMDEIQKGQFTPSELSEKAFEIYSNSDFVFYIDNDGTLKDVENFLLVFDF